MKMFVALILTALLAFAEGLFFPWWSIAVAAFLVAVFIHQRPGKAFLTGFLAVFMLWAILALFKDVQNNHVLAAKVASIFSLGGSPALIILVTGLVGGIVAGFGALTGSYARRAMGKE